MPTNAKNKFRIVAEQGSNIQTNADFDSDTIRLEGAQPGQIIYSKKVNTGLREATLIATALVDALITDDDQELGPDSTLDVIRQFFVEKLSNLSRVKNRIPINISSAGGSQQLVWNDAYYVVTKSVAETSSFTFSTIDTAIYQSTQMLLSTTVVNTKIAFADDVNVYLLLHNNDDAFVTQESQNNFNFQDIGTYLITFTVKDSGTVYMEVVKGEYVPTVYVDAPIINSYTATSQDGAYPQLVLNVTNNNTFAVNTQTELNTGLGFSANTQIGGSATTNLTIANDSLYSGTARVKFSDGSGSGAYGTPEASKLWNTTFNVTAPTSSADGSDASQSRIITITGTPASGAGSSTLFYKIWKTGQNEPGTYTTWNLSSGASSITQQVTNNAYNSIYAYGKAYTQLNCAGSLVNSVEQSWQYVLAAKPMPKLTAPTCSSSRTDGNCGTVRITVNNPNSVACNVWIKMNSGSYSQQSKTVAANNSATYYMSVANSSSKGSYSVYLTATNYVASDDYENTYRSCDTCPSYCFSPCSCVYGP